MPNMSTQLDSTSGDDILCASDARQRHHHRHPHRTPSPPLLRLKKTGGSSVHSSSSRRRRTPSMSSSSSETSSSDSRRSLRTESTPAPLSRTAAKQAAERKPLVRATSLSEFDIRKPIGTGTFGQVLLGRHTTSDTYVAIKQLHKTRVVNLRQTVHVMNERDALTACDSPFIVRCFGCFQDSKHLYIALEYAPGGELFTLLRSNRRFKPRAARIYAAQVVLALRYLHDKVGYIYRDIKPENILLDAKGNVKLCDFGFATSDRLAFTVCGTPEYMAPEIIQMRGSTVGVDWWALGVLVYEMLNGKPPHTSSDQTRLYRRILRNELVFPPHLFDAAAADLVRSLMQLDVTMRLGCHAHRGALDVMQHEWFSSLDWRRVEARTYRMPFEPMLMGRTDTTYFLTDGQTFGAKFDAPFVGKSECDAAAIDKHFENF